MLTWSPSVRAPRPGPQPKACICTKSRLSGRPGLQGLAEGRDIEHAVDFIGMHCPEGAPSQDEPQPPRPPPLPGRGPSSGATPFQAFQGSGRALGKVRLRLLAPVTLRGPGLEPDRHRLLCRPTWQIQAGREFQAHRVAARGRGGRCLQTSDSLHREQLAAS